MKKILIITTLPEKQSEASRSYRSYFFEYPKEKLATFFTSDTSPEKGYCSSYYKLTDKMMLSPRRRIEGEIILDSELVGASEAAGGNATPLFPSALKKAVRLALWKGRRWKTQKLYNWVRSFGPDALFFTWHHDLYLFKIVQEIAKAFSLPIYVTIGDDYFFNRRKGLFSSLYWRRYDKTALPILRDKNNRVFFISDRIRLKYERQFGVRGMTIHVCRESINRTEASHRQIRNIGYFGNLGFDRLNSILLFAKSLTDKSIAITICSGTKLTRRQLDSLRKANIAFLGKLSYAAIQELQAKQDAILLVESLYNVKAINKVKYSLSTKVSDSLSAGKPLLVVGSSETGLVEYFNASGLGIVFDESFDFANGIDLNLSEELYAKLIQKYWSIEKRDFDIRSNSKKFMEEIGDLIQNG